MRRPPKVKGSCGDRAESLRQKDRAPEGVLESPVWNRRRRGNTLRSGTGRKKENVHPRTGGIAAWRDSHRTPTPI